MGPAHGPGLQLVNGITGRVEIVVAGDLGQFRGMPHTLPLAGSGPGLKFTSRTSLAGRIRGKGDDRHG